MGVALPQLLARLTTAPAALVHTTSAQGGPGGLAVGGVADVCVFDPHAAWVVGADTLQSRSHHTPFEGYELLGRVRATVAHGHLAYQRA